MANFYTDCSTALVQRLRLYFLELIKESKRHHREYKTLEREVYKMTARLLQPQPNVDKCFGKGTDNVLEYDWQSRKDLQ